MNFSKHSILRHQVVTTFGSRMILLPCNNNKNKVIRRRNNSNATKNGNAILQISSGGGGGGGGSFPFARIIARCISSSSRSSRSSTGSTPPAKKEEGEEETKNSSNQFAKEKNSSSFSSSATSSSSSLWEDPVNRKKFFTFAETQLNINDPEDWYSVTRRELDQIASFYGGSEGGGHSLLKKYYNNSLIKALADVYPEINWMPWRFSAARERVPAGFWDDPANHRKFFDWAATTDKLRIRNVPEDWYKISSEEVERLGARSFLNKHYGKSLIRALMRLYPEVEWLPWRFESGAPRGFWDDPANRRWFFDWAAQQLGIFHSNNNNHNHNHNNNNNGNNNNNNSGNSNSHEGWYQVSIEDITRLGGWGLLRQIYGGSLIKALASVYPEFEWHPWRFRNVPRGFWQSDKATHRQFFDWAAKQLGIPNNNNNNNSNSNNNNISSSSSSNNNNNNSDDDFREGWYRVSSKEIERLGGSGLLDSYYGGSLYRALSSVYPEFEWHPWRFGVSRNPNHMMTMTMKKNQDSTSSSSCDKSDLVKYVEYLARALPIRELDDWYRVSVKQLRKIGGYQIIAQHGGRYLALKAVYPQHNWDESRFTKSGSQGRRSSQWQMKVVMQQLFPDEEIIEEYQHPALRFHNDESQELITMDIWVPSLSLALEYQGEQHYHDVNFFGSAEKQQRLDQAKIAQCKQAGITLVCVPYWWDQTAESLAATICAARPDLAESNSRLARAAAAGTEPVPRDAPEPSRTR